MMTTDTRMDPASERLENELREHFGSETAALDRAAERAAATIAAERKRLTRPDGSRVFTDQEHAERDKAILAVAVAPYDAVAAGITEAADAAIVQAEAELAKLDGDDGWARLTPEQQAQAANRREFIREDVTALPPHELPKRIRAALATGDRAELWLYDRYLGQRLDAERGRAPAVLAALYREVASRLANPKASETATRLRRRIEMAKVLRWRGGAVRSELDGTAAAALEQMRQRYRSQF